MTARIGHAVTNGMDAHLGSAFASQASHRTIPSQPPRVPTMSTNSSQLEGRDEELSSLTASIGALNLSERNSSVKSAKIVFGLAGSLLATIRA